MKKRVIAILFALTLCLSLIIPVFAAEDAKLRVVDNADLLSDAEEAALRSRLDEISEKYLADVVVLTVNSLDDKSPMEYADDYYDYNGYGMGTNNDGLLLLVSMESRDWWISTCGSCIDAFDDSTIESIGELIVSDLGNENYADAFDTFADECAYYLDGYINGFPFPTGMMIVISLVVGLIVALIGTGIMKGQLKSVRAQAAAFDYVKKGSLDVALAREFFLYRNVSITKKDTDSGSSTHKSSSGTTHGGGGGKF